MVDKRVYTNRLILVPITLEIVTYLINRQSAKVESMGFKINDKWPTEDTMDILPIIQEELKKNKTHTGFEVWMICKREDMTIIGDIGFKGQPNEKGEVEIGYGLIEEERRKGYGYEALSAMINWGFKHEKVNCIKADCLIDNIPSIKILEKSGMKETKRDSELVYWEIFKKSYQI